MRAEADCVDLVLALPVDPSIPSRPAMSIAGKARYGFASASGQRNSSRFALGESLYIGMRMQAERFRDEYAMIWSAIRASDWKRRSISH
jgi:hypothetical protein